MPRRLLVSLALPLLGCGGSSSLGDAGVGRDAAATDAGAIVATEPTLPSVTGTCPDMSVSGMVTVSPAGAAPRPVMLWVSDAAASLDGPLVFYWHGTGSRPEEARVGLGDPMIDRILALGGMVVAPTSDPGSGDFPWYLTTGTAEDDLLVADEVVACAIETVGIDPARIHSAGMSAGGLHTSQMGFRRASYIASIVAYSGGLLAGRPRTDDSTSRFAALLFHGGPGDVVIISFQPATEALWEELDRRGHFAAICDHGRGHRVPTDAHDSVWRFLEDHPFGAVPSPYAGGLPAGFYSACALAP